MSILETDSGSPENNASGTTKGKEPKKQKEQKKKEKSVKEKDVKEKKKKSPAIIIILILIILLALGGGLFALDKAGIINIFSKISSTEADNDTEDKEDAENQTDNEGDENEEEEDLSELEEKLAPLSEQVTAAEDKLKNEDHVAASADLADVLTAYAALASEYDSEASTDMINPLADNAFSLYTKAVLKQVEVLEAQSPTAPLYQQIEITLKSASDLSAQLKESNLTVSTDELDKNYEEFPGRYKERYILAFNDLRTGSEWSRTTAWQYMQDAASVGLVDKENPDDPLTLRYAYALAWITQRDLSEALADNSISTEDAISTILSLAESMDYNPVLMRDLALYYNAVGNSSSSKAIQNACADVYNYLANTESVYLNGEELFVPGRSSFNASSTISLNDFWYFNDFGEYAPSTTNGVSPEGRTYIRNSFKTALDSL